MFFLRWDYRWGKGSACLCENSMRPAWPPEQKVIGFEPNKDMWPIDGP